MGTVRNQRGRGPLTCRARARASGIADNSRGTVPRRGVRGAVACLTVALAAVVAPLVPAAAWAAPGIGLSLQSNHGLSSDRVTATVRSGADLALCVGGTRAVISWDGIPVGGIALDLNCSATAQFPPPATDRHPGEHEVSARIGATAEVLTAAYIIDNDAVDPNVDPNVDPTVDPTGPASDAMALSPVDPGADSGAAMGDTDPLVAPSASPSSDGRSDTDPAPNASLNAGALAAPRPMAAGSLAGMLPFLFGGLLFGVGAVVLIWVVSNSRRTAGM